MFSSLIKNLTNFEIENLILFSDLAYFALSTKPDYTFQTAISANSCNYL